MEKIKPYYQQGDVLLKLASIPENVKKRNSDIVAEGEETGHAHRIVSGEYNMFMEGQLMFIQALTEIEIDHEEHGAFKVPAGDYVRGFVREYDHFAEEARRVVD